MGLFVFLLGAVSSLMLAFVLLINFINKAEETVQKEYDDTKKALEEPDLQKVAGAADRKGWVHVTAVGSAEQAEDLVAIVRANMLFFFRAEMDVSASGVVCLDGARVGVVKNNSEQSSPWHKKNPIQLSSHDGRNLFHNSKTLLIHCKSAKEAETWYYALYNGANLSVKKEASAEQRMKKEQSHFKFLQTVLKNADSFHNHSSSLPPPLPIKSTSSSPASSPGSSPTPSPAPSPAPLNRSSSGSPLPFLATASPTASPQTHHHDLNSNLNSHLTWINALLSRMFWNIHDAPDFSAFLTRKFNKKLLKIKKPSLLKTVAICNVSFGPNLPMLTRGHLDHIGATGEVVVSGDLLYHGGFTLTISIGFEIEVMGHTLSVPVMVTVRVTRLHGRAVVCIPPPPSCRIWFAFEREPTCEIDVDTAFGTAGKVANIPRIAKIAVNALKTEMLKIIVLPNMEDFQLPKFKGQSGDKHVVIPAELNSTLPNSTTVSPTVYPRSSSPASSSSASSSSTTTRPLTKQGSTSAFDHKVIDEALNKLADKIVPSN